MTVQEVSDPAAVPCLHHQVTFTRLKSTDTTVCSLGAVGLRPNKIGSSPVFVRWFALGSAVVKGEENVGVTPR